MSWDNLIEPFCLEGRVHSLDEWALLRVAGRDSESFLQGQTTNDVKALNTGASHLSALIERGGRVVSFFYLLKRGDGFLLLLLKELLDRTVSRLEQYIICEDVAVTPLTTEGITLYSGPLHYRLLKECSDLFALSLFSLPALLFWTGDDITTLRTFNIPPVAHVQLEALKLFSVFPNWKIDLDEESLINETLLENRAISYGKGCFLGQEAAARVHNKRGAFYITVLLAVEGEPPLNPQELVGQTFHIDGKRGGEVAALIKWDGRLFFRARLHRDFIVYGDPLAIHFADSPDLPDQPITVIPAPLQEPIAVEEFASAIYHHALKIFASNEDGEESAITLLESAIELNPALADAYESLGVMHGRRGEYDEALLCMERLLEVDPESVMAHSNRSLYLMKLGRLEEAEEEKAKATVASFKSARLARVESDTTAIEEEKKRESEAAQERQRKVEMFLRVLNIDPDDLLANFSLGRLYNSSGEFGLAEGHLRKVIKKDSQYSAAYLELGIALNGLSRRDEAQEIYKRGCPIAAAKGDQMIANRIEANLLQLLTQ